MRTTAEQDTKDLARGAGVNYLGFVARLGARVPFLILAGLLYGEARFGEYTFVVTFVETTAAVALFGQKRSLFKFLSEARGQEAELYRAIANGVALTVSVGVAFTLGVAWGGERIADLLRFPSAGGALRMAAPAILLIVLSDILLVTIRFTRQMRFEVWARSIAEPITLTGTVVLAHQLGARESGLLIGYLASMVVAALLSGVFFAQLFSVRACLGAPLRWRDMRRLVHFSGPTAVYELLIMLADKVDIFLVAYFSPASVVGIYGMARQFSTVTKKIRQGFDRILPPVLSECIAAGDLQRARKQLCTVSRWILTAQMPVVMVLALYAEDLLGLLGGGFAGGATVLALLMIGDAINGSLGVSELPIVFLRPVLNVYLGAAMLGLAILGVATLTPALGPEGAALGMLLTFALVNAGRVAVNRQAFGLVTVGPGLLKPVLAALPAAGIVLGLRWLTQGTPAVGRVFGIPLLLLVYAVALYGLGLAREDREQLENVRRRIRRPGRGPELGSAPGER